MEEEEIMEPIQWNQYKRGEKIFWIYAALDILYFGLNGFGKGGIEILCTVIWQIILLNFIYYGYSWVLYCMMAAGGILFAKGCFELLLLVFEGDWMIYAYSPSRLVITGLKSVIAVIQFLLVIKKDLRYFSHIRGLARKEELSEEAAEKIEKGDY